MLVSIIIPTYNRVAYLLDCINSISEQTYEDFEVIIVSDGSTDNSKKAIAELKDKRIKFIELDQNYGYPAKARNEGIKIANGEFIAFCDDDDLWESNKLQKQIDIVNKGKDFIFSNYSYLEGKKGRLYELYLKYFLKILINKLPVKMSHLFFTITNPIINSSVLVKRELVSGILFKESKKFRASEDYQLWIKIYDKSKPFYLNDKLVKYRTHDNNISSDFIANLKRCILVFKDYQPERFRHKIFKKLGILVHTIRVKIKR